MESGRIARGPAERACVIDTTSAPDDATVASDSPRVRSGKKTRPIPPPAGEVLTAHDWNNLQAALGLSDTQTAILREACNEDSVIGIATRLRLSPHTVHTHRTHLFRKLGVRGMAGAIAVAFGAHVAMHDGEKARPA